MSRRRPLRGLKHRRAAAVPAAPGSPTCSAPAPARPQPPTPGLRMPALHRCPDLLSPSGAPLGAEDSRVQAASPGRVGPACNMRHVHGLVSVSLHGRASLSCLPSIHLVPGGLVARQEPRAARGARPGAQVVTSTLLASVPCGFWLDVVGFLSSPGAGLLLPGASESGTLPGGRWCWQHVASSSYHQPVRGCEPRPRGDSLALARALAPCTSLV